MSLELMEKIFITTIFPKLTTKILLHTVNVGAFQLSFKKKTFLDIEVPDYII